jgi:SpoVK/Ycf46/Vps4 family AAA+-type ATPase
MTVFLRTLEYYPGILLLTSNRVGTFDAAFKSRIQVALHYPPLDTTSRRQIWLNFFEMLRSDSHHSHSPTQGVDFDGILQHLDELARYEMNGRQIRNAVTTARQLALFEGRRVEWEDLEAAIAVASEFERRVRAEEEGWVLDGDGGSVVMRGRDGEGSLVG